MRVLITSVLVLATAAASLAQIISIDTSPSDLDVYIDGEYAGTSPVVLEGPYGDVLKVDIKGDGYLKSSEYLEIAEDGGDLDVLISTGYPTGFSWKWFLLSFAGAFTASLLITIAAL